MTKQIAMCSGFSLKRVSGSELLILMHNICENGCKRVILAIALVGISQKCTTFWPLFWSLGQLLHVLVIEISYSCSFFVFHQAARYGRLKHLEHLLYYGADMDTQNEAGNTALHVCALYKQDTAARTLLFRGADRSVKNKASQTAFQVGETWYGQWVL